MSAALEGRVVLARNSAEAFDIRAFGRWGALGRGSPRCNLFCCTRISAPMA